jgi:hypothetical protein
MVLVAGLLSTLVEGFFRSVIVVPLLEMLAVLYRVYAIPPQALIWWSMVGLGIFLGLRALWTWPKISRKRDEAPLGAGRVARLATMLTRAQRSDYFRWQLALELERLAVAALQQAQGTSASAIRHAIQSGSLRVGPSLETLFQVRAAIPSYRQFMTERAASGRKPIAALAGLDLEAAVHELEDWFDLGLGAG